MKKIIMAAGIAASMLFATSAFAETTNSIKPDYNPTSGNVTLTGEGVKSRATTTYLVISLGTTAPTGIYTGEITDAMIKQIDQVDGTATVEQILVGAGLDDGFYEVRMGGDGNVAYGVFEVKTITEPDLSTQEGAKEYYKTCEQVIGDIDNDGAIGLTDATFALKHELGTLLTREALQAADVDGDKSVGLTDATNMLKYELGARDVIDGVTKVKNKEAYILESSAK